VTADSVQGKQSGGWCGDGLSQQLQHLGLRIVKVEPDGAAAAGICESVHPMLSSLKDGSVCCCAYHPAMPALARQLPVSGA
jgi:hypothetical protein